MNKINKIIDDTPFVTELQKNFYKTMLLERKQKILDAAYNKLISREAAKEMK